VHEALSKFAQTGGLVLFVTAFVLVLIYALAPSNQKNFDRAARDAIQDNEGQDD